METLNCATLSSHKQEQVEEYQILKNKFDKACSQVVLLNNRILDTQTRYDRAVKHGHKVYRYVCRLNLMTLEGVRNAFYEYASQKAEEVDAAQDRLVAAGLMNSEYEPMEQD